MKTQGQVLQKIKQVKFRYLKKYLKKYLQQKSENCLFNRPSFLGVEGIESVSICGFGMEKADWVASPCDFRFNDDLAKTCPKYEALHTKESLKKEFEESVSSLSLPEVALRFPDLAALMWVLGDEDLPLEDSDD